MERINETPTDPKRLLEASDVEAETGIPVRTLAQWRYLNKGPRYLKLGNRVRYRRADIDQWQNDSLVTPGAA